MNQVVTIEKIRTQIHSKVLVSHTDTDGNCKAIILRWQYERKATFIVKRNGQIVKNTDDLHTAIRKYNEL